MSNAIALTMSVIIGIALMVLLIVWSYQKIKVIIAKKRYEKSRRIENNDKD